MGTFAAVGASSAQRIEAGSRLTVSITGTFVQKIALERQDGAVWRPIREYRAAGASDALPVETEAQYYRLNCYARTSGTSTYALASAAASVNASPGVDNGTTLAVLRVNEASNTHVITVAPGTETANRQIAVPVLGGNVTMTLLELAQLFTAAQGFGSAADATGVVAVSFGSTIASGLQVKVIEEVVSLVAAGAKYRTMTTSIPAGAVILAVQVNNDSLVVAGGTSVKVGIGDHTGVCNTYGATAALTKNAKANTIPAWSPLAGAMYLDVCACATVATGLGDTNFSGGLVRVRIAYLVPANLPDAA